MMLLLVLFSAEDEFRLNAFRVQGEGDVIFHFALDFGNERLEFSVFDDIGVKDTG